MISSYFHQGSGIGNQLHRYIMARVLALDNEWEFGMIHPENFKGSSFMHLNMGLPVTGIKHEYFERRTNNAQGVDIRDYDWSGIKKIENYTVIDGEFQGELYFSHRMNEIRDWLKVEPMTQPDNLCVINFRGGEYTAVPDLFLPQSYWDLAVMKMKKINPFMVFEVHTDDPETASRFFPDFLIYKDIGFNWRSVRYAHYLILSNSSFAILPALLNENAQKIFAPKNWARRNTHVQALAYNKYKSFTHI